MKKNVKAKVDAMTRAKREYDKNSNMATTLICVVAETLAIALIFRDEVSMEVSLGIIIAVSAICGPAALYFKIRADYYRNLFLKKKAIAAK